MTEKKKPRKRPAKKTQGKVIELTLSEFQGFYANYQTFAAIKKASAIQLQLTQYRRDVLDPIQASWEEHRTALVELHGRPDGKGGHIVPEGTPAHRKFTADVEAAMLTAIKFKRCTLEFEKVIAAIREDIPELMVEVCRLFCTDPKWKEPAKADIQFNTATQEAVH